MADTSLTVDAFLGGRLTLLQPKQGYRAGVDPVLLAASVPARAGQSVLELGCGVGTAALCLATRVSGLTLAGLEIQETYAKLARRNAEQNQIDMQVVTGNLSDMPAVLKSERFDHVIANPPYFDRTAGARADDKGRETALGEQTPLSVWVQTASKRTAPGGYVSFIHRADRLPDLLGSATQYFGSLELLPLIPRTGKPARLVILRGRKGGRSAFKIHDGKVLHAGHEHPGDRENYTPSIACVLRDGAALEFGG